MSEGSREHAGELTGRLLGGRYRLGALLGQGGMGVVYTATQESLARPVAVKVLQPALAQNLDAVARFRAEAERAGRLAHPHIVQILDFDHEPDGAAWIAMELLQGEPLASRIARAPMSEREVVRVAMETLSALEAAHVAGLVHRDLKPDNLFLADVPGIGASVKVLDFGIAKLLEGDGAQKLTATGMLVGTPLYMAPEQARGEDVDARADLYSLGCVLYEALTGRPPLTGKNYNALLFAILSEQAPPLEGLRTGVSPALAAVVHRAIDKRAEARFQSAGEMAEALRAVTPTSLAPAAYAPRDEAIGTAATLATPEPAPRGAAPTPPLGGASSPALGRSAAIGTEPTLAGTTPAPSVGAASPTPAASAELGTAPPTPTTRESPAATAAPAPPAPTTTTGGSAARTWAIAAAVAIAASLTVLVVDRVLPREAPVSPAASTTTAVAITPPSQPETPPPPQLPPPMQPLEPPAPPAVPEPPEPPTTSVEQAPSAPPAEAEAPRGPDVPSTPAPRPRARPRYAPRVTIGGLRFGGMGSSAAVRGPIEAAGGWGECWPSEIEPPTVNRGRDFWIDIEPDGSVASVEPTPNSVEPAAFSSCVVRRLRPLTFSAPVTGERVRVQVGFSIGS